MNVFIDAVVELRNKHDKPVPIKITLLYERKKTGMSDELKPHQFFKPDGLPLTDVNLVAAFQFNL